VLSIQVRLRAAASGFQDLAENPVRIGSHQILRVDNDPSRPNMGSLRIQVEGGR